MIKEQELEEITRTVANKNATLGKISEEMKTIKSNIKNQENQLSCLQNSTRGLEERVQSLKDEVRENQTKQKEISTSEKFEKSHMERYETCLKDAKKNLSKKQNEIQDFTEEASSVGERLPELR